MNNQSTIMKNPENCRNAFERWMREAPNFNERAWLGRDKEGYMFEVTESRWQGYQAAWAYNQPLLDELAGACQMALCHTDDNAAINALEQALALYNDMRGMK